MQARAKHTRRYIRTLENELVNNVRKKNKKNNNNNKQTKKQQQNYHSTLFSAWPHNFPAEILPWNSMFYNVL